MRVATIALTLIGSWISLRAQEPSVLDKSWDSVVAHLPADAANAARILNHTYRGPGIPLLYWPKRGLADSLLRDLDVSDGPCGAIVFVQSPTIPPRDDRLVGEFVAELDSTGRVLRRWTVPSNPSPLALHGDTLWIYLYARDRTDLALAVTAEGRYVAVPSKTTEPEQYAECPPNSVFPNSGYAKCLAFADPPRRKRLIIYEAPCT
jgi:hypothetical protein